MTGNDMSYRDLELIVRIQQWDASSASATVEGEEPCGEATCYRIMLAPTHPNEFPCKRYRLWYSRDDLLLRRVDLYDMDDRLVKRVTCRDYFATGAFQTPRTCLIEHVPTNVRSTITVSDITYGVEASDDLFSVTNLGN